MDDLLQRIALHRDPQAFQDLFRLCGPRIKAMMMRQGADAAAAEDIAQEVGSVLPPKALDPGNEVLMPAPLARATGLRRETIPWRKMPYGLELIRFNGIKSGLSRN